MDAGLLFALATILKLNCLFLLPFFLLRKRFDVFLGYFIGGILIILASVVFNGFDVTVHYITTDFPRISTYGEDGYTDQIFASNLYPTTGIAPYSVKQGIVYTSSMQNFDGKPNLVQPLITFFSQHYLNPSMSLISLVVFGFIFLVIVSRERNFSRRKETFKVKDEFLFWQLGLIVILLASPMTWIMNLVWLCPLIFYALYYYKNRGELNKSWSLYLLIGGLLLVGLPDRSYFPFTFFNYNENIITDILVNYFWSNKYQIGEILLAFFFLTEYRAPSRESGAAQINNSRLKDGVEGRVQAESLHDLETPQLVQVSRQPAQIAPVRSKDTVEE